MEIILFFFIFFGKAIAFYCTVSCAWQFLTLTCSFIYVILKWTILPTLYCDNPPPPKQNYSTLFLQLLSITLHLFVKIRNKLHKRKQSQSQIIIKLQNLTDYTTSITNLIMMCGATLLTVFLNRVQPEEANDFPYYMIVYGCHMLVPFPVIFAISLMYFTRQPKLRQTIYRELVDRIVSI
jgi:hypothetical protein